VADSTFDLSAVVILQQRFDAGQSLTDDEVKRLFEIIDALRQGRAMPTLVRLSPEEYAAFGAVHTSLVHALKQTGLHLQRATTKDEAKLPWVWFYRWDSHPKQGPYGTLSAAVGSAILQIRSGVLQKKS
jgi:hypothetical protein